MVKSVAVHNVILYTITSCCITGLFDDIIILYYYHWYCTVLSLYCICGSPNRKESSPNSSSAICCKLEPPRTSPPRPPRSCGLVPSSVQAQLPVSVSADLCDTMHVLFFAQGAKAYFAWVVFSRPHRNSCLISRHHANIRRWCYGVAPWVDVSEIPWRLTDALVAELSVCVALGWSLYEIYSVQKLDQSRHLAETKLHPEYPHRKKINPAPKQEISVFCEPEHPKKHATLG